ncbi:hypothetical protein [Luedemannella helvata]|uniref:Uncharacterized protein n=1 Tax=Luedemannella helvata TaxID=349315 RepID=A0ABN2LA10_9ACTN
MRKLAGLALLALLAFYVVSDPHGAATTARTVFSGLKTLASSLTTFMGALSD